MRLAVLQAKVPGDQYTDTWQRPQLRRKARCQRAVLEQPDQFAACRGTELRRSTRRGRLEHCRVVALQLGRPTRYRLPGDTDTPSHFGLGYSLGQQVCRAQAPALQCFHVSFHGPLWL